MALNTPARLMLASALALLGVAPVAVRGGDPKDSKIDLPGAGGAKDEGVPPVFSAMTFEDAIDANKTDGNLLVVKFTAEWCGPCKLMDRTTWRDEGVVKLVRDSGRAMQVDVDKQREIAQQYSVRAMPTMIAFKGGEPIDRIVGYRDAAGLSKWLGAVAQGKTEAGLLEDRATQAGDALPVRERMELARSLLQADQADKALPHYLWLWNNLAKKDPAMVGVRVSFLANEIGDLCERSEAAKAEFVKLRDQAEGRLKGADKSWDDLTDWLALNGAVGQEHKTLEWFDRIKGEPDSGPTLRRYSARLEPLLEENGRWADLGRVIEDPTTRLRREWGMVAMSSQAPGADEALRAQVRKMAVERFRGKVSTLYAALILAGRQGEAADFAAKAVQTDDTPEMRVALVERGVELGAAEPSMKALLDQAAGKGAEVAGLRGKLEAALAKPGR